MRFKNFRFEFCLLLITCICEIALWLNEVSTVSVRLTLSSVGLTLKKTKPKSCPLLWRSGQLDW